MGICPGGFDALSCLRHPQSDELDRHVRLAAAFGLHDEADLAARQAAAVAVHQFRGSVAAAQAVRFDVTLEHPAGDAEE